MRFRLPSEHPKGHHKTWEWPREFVFHKARAFRHCRTIFAYLELKRIIGTWTIRLICLKVSKARGECANQGHLAARKFESEQKGEKTNHRPLCDEWLELSLLEGMEHAGHRNITQDLCKVLIIMTDYYWYWNYTSLWIPRIIPLESIHKSIAIRLIRIAKVGCCLRGRYSGICHLGQLGIQSTRCRIWRTRGHQEATIKGSNCNYWPSISKYFKTAWKFDWLKVAHLN